MAQGHQMRALGRKDGDETPAGSTSSAALDGEAATAIPSLEPDENWAEEAELPVSASRFGWFAPALAILAMAGWTAFFGWAMRAELFTPSPDAPRIWANLIGQWAVPTALIGIVWLLVMRSSRAEAHRFAATAALLSRESAELEERLKVVNRELSLAREFLAAEARDLEALGRIAAERISSELQALIATNGAQVETIGNTSETALSNMNRLRDDLPVIANAARDVANQIGGAGRNAQDQLERLVAGFERLNQFGSASEAQVTSLGLRVGETIDGFETQLAAIAAFATERFTTLQSDAEAYRAQLDQLEREALAALEDRTAQTSSRAEALTENLRSSAETLHAQLETAIARLHEALVEKVQIVEQRDLAANSAAVARMAQLDETTRRFDEMLAARNLQFAEQIEQRQAVLDTHEAQASEVLAQRLSALDEAIAQRREAQLAEAEKLRSQSDAIAERLAQLGAVMAEIGDHGDAARAKLGAGLEELGQKLSSKRAALQQTESQLANLTESSVRLLEIIQSGARATREELPAAIAAAEAALGTAVSRAGEINQLMLGSGQQGSELSDYLVQTRGEIDAAKSAMTDLKAHLAEQADDALARLQGLRGGFARLADEGGTLARETQDQLRGALASLEAAIAQAFEALDSGAREKLAGLAQGMGAEAVEALERALRNETASTIGKLEQAAAHASGVGREATIQLRDQLVRVNELTGNLEQRIARAREQAEEQVNNDFARRMALITDSLNSAAIDIGGALSTEVADTAWDAYLKGDRGIFTRRAVRLIDAGMVRDIAALYSNDETFNANVSRYIHDFEALLRATLSTRDGHALSVTMLGSDMGKLYVALAQAIERFRN
jgi:chromosome segregation ATPase